MLERLDAGHGERGLESFVGRCPRCRGATNRSPGLGEAHSGPAASINSSPMGASPTYPHIRGPFQGSTAGCRDRRHPGPLVSYRLPGCRRLRPNRRPIAKCRRLSCCTGRTAGTPKGRCPSRFTPVHVCVALIPKTGGRAFENERLPSPGPSVHRLALVLSLDDAHASSLLFE